MNPLIRKMLDRRGYTDEFLIDINERRHKLPRNIDDLAERLADYRSSGELIVLLTDFDMDGITSGIIGLAGLAELGFNVALYLPETESYGFKEADIDRILEQYPECKAILTADVGISAFDGIRYAYEHGIEVLVTDHHRPVADHVPCSSVVVDPMCDVGDEYFGGICGAHVLYLVLERYAQLYCDPLSEVMYQIRRLKVFAGLGTISDSMPVYYENRTLIRDAVSICRLIYADGEFESISYIPGCVTYQRAFLGLLVMLRCFREIGKISDASSIDETFFGYYVAPAFNAIKRMNGDITDAYGVFFDGDAAAGEEHMKRILELTDERKRIVSESMSALLDPANVQPYAPYIFITDAISGIRGLLAQRIMSITGEPAFVVGVGEDGVLKGSGRCPSWFPFLELCDLETVHGAGHNAAFGIRIDGDEGCRDLLDFLSVAIPDNKPSDLADVNRPDFVISTFDESADTDIDVELFMDFVEELEAYRPFGNGFPAPDIELEFRAKEGNWRYLGQDKNHVKVILPHGLVLVCFNQAGLFPNGFDLNVMPSVVSVRGSLNINEYNGSRSIQFLGHFSDDVGGSASPVALNQGENSDGVDVIVIGKE